MKVKVRGVGVKLAGKWCYKGDIAQITDEEYLANKEYLIVIEGEVKKETTTVTPQVPQNNNTDVELKVLREKAKDLGIKGASNMKKETLESKIAEKEKEFEEVDNSEEFEENVEDGHGGENPDGE